MSRGIGGKFDGGDRKGDIEKRKFIERKWERTEVQNNSRKEKLPKKEITSNKNKFLNKKFGGGGLKRVGERK